MASTSSIAIETHHTNARKVVLTVQKLLVELETGRDTSIELQTHISQHINALAREINILEELLPGEGARRPVWRKKISALQDESASQRAALSKFAARLHTKRKEQEERDALIQRIRGNGDHSVCIESGLAEGKALQQVDSQLDSLTGNATSVLSALRQQSSTLKGVQKKLLDFSHTLGLSDNVMRLIESRQFWDKVIMVTGMILTLALLWYVFVHLRRPPEEAGT
uniref:Vesicle transport v-SNARE N-terminal domain-containing protein n=1 Tax=Coccolithus braarudii TaxID=221442 RepID=A0A7S0LMW9_9EUKA|mmetsp:Transcript_4927/g.10890  ORF Transcript_4927/g.10890 Transcript_4927/m.10890 type:complete len:225 (+) Transcript_4927:163-837(+)